MKFKRQSLKEILTGIRLVLISLFFFIICFSSCKNSSHGLKAGRDKVPVNIERFDKDLFLMNTDTLAQGISWLYEKYDDFLEVFSYHIINIGSPSSRDYQAFLSMFLNDRLNREVFSETQKIFPELDALEEKLSRAFTIYKSAYPDAELPRVVAFVSRFNNPSCFSVGNYLGIGLDRYFGVSSAYYRKLDTPSYQKANMFPGKIPSDLMVAWATANFPFNDSVDNVLARMIHEGKLLYFAGSMLPDEPDSLILGYSRSQMRWARENEEQMWTYLVEKKLLFSRDAMDIRKLTGAAPFTYFFSNESPGRAGAYIGWRIFSEFARRSPQMSFSQLMNETDYEKILRVSKYNP